RSRSVANISPGIVIRRNIKTSISLFSGFSEGEAKDLAEDFSNIVEKSDVFTRLSKISSSKREANEVRPLNGFLGKLGIKHTGVVATTKDGGRYLIHKGSGYGTKSSTVVLNANHMSKNWKKTGEKLTNGKTISNLMKDGYVNQKYGVGRDKKICWQSSGNIMDKAGRRKRVAC
ncbi:Hypothetical predicted protein, partial [Mytilus galloprovincialis]